VTFQRITRKSRSRSQGRSRRPGRLERRARQMVRAAKNDGYLDMASNSRKSAAQNRERSAARRGISSTQSRCRVPCRPTGRRTDPGRRRFMKSLLWICSARVIISSRPPAASEWLRRRRVNLGQISPTIPMPPHSFGGWLHVGWMTVCRSEPHAPRRQR